MLPEEIAEAIVNLTIALDNREELRKAWRVIRTALRYLNSKDNFFEEEATALELIKKMKEDRVEKYV